MGVMAVGMLLAAGIIVAVLISVMAMAVRYRDRVRRPCCGRCRYPVEGLTSLTCPECGADFRREGILVPGVRPRNRVYVAEMTAAWVLVCVFGSLLTAGFVGMFDFARVMQFSRNEVLTPSSGALTSINASVQGTAGANDSAMSAPAEAIVLQTGQTSAVTPLLLEVDLSMRTWQVRPSTGAGPVVSEGRLPVTDADVAAWLKATGVSGVNDAATDIAALTTYINSGAKLSSSTALGSVLGGSSVSFRPAGWVMVASIAFWAIMFFPGMVWIVRVTSRKAEAMRRPAAISPAAM